MQLSLRRFCRLQQRPVTSVPITLLKAKYEYIDRTTQDPVELFTQAI